MIVYSTDHGDWLGDHGLLLKGPMAYEGLLRVGLLFEGPGVPGGQGRRRARLDARPGADVLRLRRDRAAAGRRTAAACARCVEGDATRDFAQSEWDLRASRCGVDLRLRTVRTRRHKLTLELNSGAGELYDLDEDPQEMHNRFDDAACAGVRRELSAMIASRPDDARPEPLPQVGMA